MNIKNINSVVDGFDRVTDIADKRKCGLIMIALLVVVGYSMYVMNGSIKNSNIVVANNTAILDSMVRGQERVERELNDLKNSLIRRK